MTRFTLPKMAGAAAAQLDRIDPATALYFFFGADGAGARSLADRFAKAMPADAERIELTGAQLKADPARLSDEAAAISLFGEARYIWVTLGESGEDAVAAVEGLIAANIFGNPVLLVGGNIRATSKLVKLVEGYSRAHSFLCYAPSASEMGTIIRDQAASLGLRTDSQSVRMLSDLCGDDRALVLRELEKLALYLDASPDSVKPLPVAAIIALGADTQEEDLAGAVDAMLGGKVDMLPQHLADLEATGVAAIRVLRALTTRAQLLANLRPDVDRGRTPKQAVEAAGKAIFWRDQDKVADQLRRWDSRRIARLISRINAAEAALKAPQTPGFILLRQMAVDMTRQAAG
jgi:DNA polymerase III subunit delta